MLKKHQLGQQDHLDRDGRQIFPGELAEQRQVKLAVGVHPRDAAETQDVGARFLHEGRVGAVAGELEREVGFDAGVDFARAAVVNIPAAVGKLALQDVLRRSGAAASRPPRPTQCMKRT